MAHRNLLVVDVVESARERRHRQAASLRHGAAQDPDFRHHKQIVDRLRGVPEYAPCTNCP
jgi:hypothetical protein